MALNFDRIMKLIFLLRCSKEFLFIKQLGNSVQKGNPKNFEILSKENIDNRIKSLSNPVHATTVFSYSVGRNLIIDKYGEFPPGDNFFDLLNRPVLPSDLI